MHEGKLLKIIASAKTLSAMAKPKPVRTDDPFE